MFESHPSPTPWFSLLTILLVLLCTLVPTTITNSDIFCLILVWPGPHQLVRLDRIKWRLQEVQKWVHQGCLRITLIQASCDTLQLESKKPSCHHPVDNINHTKTERPTPLMESPPNEVDRDPVKKGVKTDIAVTGCKPCAGLTIHRPMLNRHPIRKW